MQKPSRKSLKNRADKLFSLSIRAFGSCQLQGKDKIKCSSVLQCAHIVGRANMRLRWDIWNVLCICSGHHWWYTNNPEAWREIIKKEFPDSWKYVNKHRTEIWKGTVAEVLEGLVSL